jgi:hypothetical protein
MRRRKLDPRSRRRAGREVSRRLRKESWEMAKRNWWRLSIFLFCWLGLTAFLGVAVHWWSGPATGSFVGGFALGLLPLFWMAWTVAGGLAHRGMGVDAERWTAAELAKLDSRVWTVFHDVPIDEGNVDHVVVGPGRVFAIETKWTSVGGKYVKKCAGQAAWAAGKLAKGLRNRGVSREVVPLLVMWGPGVADELGKRPTMEGRTRVMAGAHSKVWLERMNDAKDRLEIDYAVTQAIADIIETDALVASRDESPTSA